MESATAWTLWATLRQRGNSGSGSPVDQSTASDTRRTVDVARQVVGSSRTRASWTERALLDDLFGVEPLRTGRSENAVR